MKRYCHKLFSTGMTCVSRTKDGECMNSSILYRCKYSSKHKNIISDKKCDPRNLIVEPTRSRCPYKQDSNPGSPTYEYEYVIKQVKYMLSNYIRAYNKECHTMNTSIVSHPYLYYDYRAKIEVLIELLKKLNVTVTYEMSTSMGYPYIVNMYVNKQCIYEKIPKED